MRVKEAKNFLVAEIKRQAELEDIPLEDPEIQMLYFTEQGGLSPEMQKFTDSFDEEYDTQRYEKKIAGLMKRAYKRLKREGSPAKGSWDAAIRILKKGDHYILVMWGGFSPAAFLVILVLISCAIAMLAGFRWLAQRYQPPNPHTVQIVFVCCIALFFLLRNQLSQVMSFLIGKTIVRWFGTDDEHGES
jgi:hypothetical protein